MTCLAPAAAAAAATSATSKSQGYLLALQTAAGAGSGVTWASRTGGTAAPDLWTTAGADLGRP